jgi:sphingomyelin phosphodiesterase acid-like 3
VALSPAAAHPQAAPPAHERVETLFVSDIHFEPFWDPGKTAKFTAAPVSAWKAILESPPSRNRQIAFDRLQSTCKARGVDTPYPLLRSSLGAIKSHASGAAFIILSGDLMAHGFECKYKTLLPRATAQDYTAFTEKTIRFVISELESAAPGVPVYAALGNNDTDCGDYQIDAHSAFLAAVGKMITQQFPPAERSAALRSFSAGGNYSVLLPSPMERTRLIVLDDLFLSVKHSSCARQPDTAEGDAQLEWLQEELARARSGREKVWIMAHIPPGVDAFSTLAHLTGPCGRPAKMFLASDKLATILADSSDVVTLAVFAHTHEDEIKLLEKNPADAVNTASAPSDPGESNHGGVPLKIVPSISPINGNLPSFTVAQVDPTTATLLDYQVIAGSGSVRWTQQYDYGREYGEDSFSPAAVKDLLTKFAADRDLKSRSVRGYIRNFSPGNPVPLLSLVWPAYVCTLTHETESGFRECACPARATP